jgi:hypothetical protein
VPGAGCGPRRVAATDRCHTVTPPGPGHSGYSISGHRLATFLSSSCRPLVAVRCRRPLPTVSNWDFPSAPPGAPSRYRRTESDKCLIATDATGPGRQPIRGRGRLPCRPELALVGGSAGLTHGQDPTPECPFSMHPRLTVRSAMGAIGCNPRVQIGLFWRETAAKEG